MRDCIVLGISNNNLRKHLLQEKSLNLTKCIHLCCSAETTMSQFKSISGATSNVDNNAYVNYVSSKPHSDRKSTSKQKNDRNAKHDKPRTGENKARK